ncbi:gamma-butyrobetaine hydroxylase-like domain-containing protein [Alkalimonas collagenimarina]|uniref:Gamma-butyrobetaine hydroxylase-like domain-containing protein n=1 Tax=Alkalimonas collagenimarina TaxID=400390 RepID=A0ABT9GVF2_9GAMM|nr:gamma-butyrobetaine hydroxylase-like domain-containing protein [Alkalimonas collagenimarina]MDP4535035.1 gamma-butyrobetaine hydroxylase-like domain-containing protein [Alkalimonas collagenimarina]
MAAAPALTRLHYHQRSKQLDICFADGTESCLSAEFLRVHSPSAEVQGHGNPKLVLNKSGVGISTIEPTGHYGVRIVFDDGHQTGIFSTHYLYHLCQHHQELWQQYQENVAQQQQIPIRLKL